MPVRRMPDLEPNPNYRSPDPEPPKPVKPKRKLKRRKKASGSTRKTVAQTTQREVRPLPRSSVSQPRDGLGRFARATGKVIKGALKSIAQTNAAARRRQNLELRERAAAVAEREQKLGIRKKVIRRRRSKTGRRK